MSIVVFYDRKTGDIIKVDNHPGWKEREVRLDYYRDNPGALPDGAGILTVPPDIEWDNKPENWIVCLTPEGNPQLRRREEAQIEEEINRAKEEVLLELVKARLSPGARAYLERKTMKRRASNSNPGAGTT